MASPAPCSVLVLASLLSCGHQVTGERLLLKGDAEAPFPAAHRELEAGGGGWGGSSRPLPARGDKGNWDGARLGMCCSASHAVVSGEKAGLTAF